MADEKTYTQEELDAKIAEANKALEAKRTELLEEAKSAKAALREMKDQQDALAARLQEAEQKAAAQNAGVSDDKLAELRKTMEADFERRYAPFKTKVGELEAQLGEKDGEIRSLRLDTKVKDVMGKKGARSERVNDLFRLTADRYDLTDDGEVILKENREVPLDKYVAEELSNEYPEFFNGSGSSGGGASRSTASGGGFKRTIAAGDNDAFVSNLDAIISGEMEVR